MESDATFLSAAERVRTGQFDVTNDQKLLLYALYKTVTSGSPPSVARSSATWGPVSYAKQKAWEEIAGKYSQEQARSAYVELVRTLSEG